MSFYHGNRDYCSEMNDDGLMLDESMCTAINSKKDLSVMPQLSWSMRIFQTFCIFSITFISQCARVDAAASVVNEKVCIENGFDSSVLTCTSCDQIKNVVGDEELESECRSCCQEDVVDVKYEQAILEIDKRFLKGLTELADVVKMKKKLNLDVKYQFGARPMLHMYKEEGNDVADESLAVHSWSKDTFKEYLRAHLTPS